jgi:hypothetical protein
MRAIKLLVLATLLSLAQSVRAEVGSVEVLDQDNRNAAGSREISPRSTCAQTFTAGVTGQLSRTVIQIYKKSVGGYPINLALCRTLNGQPDQTQTLGRFALQAADIPYTPFDPNVTPTSISWAAAGIDVEAGDQLALIAQSDEAQSTGYWWRISGQGSDEYGYGEAWRYDAEFSRWLLTSGPTLPQDFWFQTYVMVPEPASSAVAMGLCAVAASRRRSR